MEQNHLKKDIITILSLTALFILLLVGVLFLDRNTHILQGIAESWVK